MLATPIIIIGYYTYPNNSRHLLLRMKTENYSLVAPPSSPTSDSILEVLFKCVQIVVFLNTQYLGVHKRNTQ